MYESTDTNLRVYAATRGSILGGGRRGVDNQSRDKMYSSKRGEEMAVAKLYISKGGRVFASGMHFPCLNAV